MRTSALHSGRMTVVDWPDDGEMFEIACGIFVPRTHPRQLAMLAADTPTALFGGGTGSGKSALGIYDALTDMCVPGAHALGLRRTANQLNGPGGLIEKGRRQSLW